MERISEQIKKLRKAANITQGTLAETLGVHLQTVSKWERGITEPDISQLGDIAAALSVSLERLLGVEEGELVYTGAFRSEQLGKCLCSLRSGRGESQEQLAEHLSTSATAISRWENGVSCPDLVRLVALAEHYAVPVSLLYFGVLPEAPEPERVRVRRRGRLAVLLTACLGAVGCLVAALVLFLLPSFGAGARPVTVQLDGEDVLSQTEWFTPTSPVREGYTFVAWVDERGERVEFPKKVSEGEKFFSRFALIEYPIDYWLNGGNFTERPVTVIHAESGSLPLPLPQKEGDTFLGWYADGGYEGEALTSIRCNFAPVTLYARWERAVYTVRYEMNGGILYGNNPSQVTQAESSVLLEPIREGHTFVGWYDAPSGGQRVEQVGGDGARNVTLYAVWQRSDARYAVTYELAGGTLSSANPAFVAEGEVAALHAPVRPGYNFVGWCDRATGEGTMYEVLHAITADLHLYAVWEPAEYTLLYVYEGNYLGEQCNPNRITFGTRVTLLPVALYGHDFLGWFDSERDGNQVTVIDEHNLLGLHTLYARYRPKQFSVQLRGEGGSFSTPAGEQTSHTYVVKFGETLSLPLPTLADHTFLGWQNERGEFVERVDVTNVADMILTAVWRLSELTYDISYVLNGGSFTQPNPTIAKSEHPQPLYPAQKGGYFFLGWCDRSDGTGTFYDYTPYGRETPIVLYAIWQVIKVSGSTDDFTYERAEGEISLTAYTGPTGENVDLVLPAAIEGVPVTAVEFSLASSSESGVTFRSVRLPDGTLRVGDNFTNDVAIIQPFTLPASVVELGEYSMAGRFEGGFYFAEGSRLTAVRENAFRGTYAPNVLVFPEGVELLGYMAANPVCVPGIVLPTTLKVIEREAVGCPNITVYVPKNVETVMPNAIKAAKILCERTKDAVPNYAFGADQRVEYGVLTRSVTLQDGDSTRQLRGGALALGRPERPGHTFLGWKDAATGEYVSRYFLPAEDVVLVAHYEAVSPDDGRAPDRAKVIAPGTAHVFDVEGSPFDTLYLRLDITSPVQVLPPPSCRIVVGGREVTGKFLCNPGELIVLRPYSEGLRTVPFSVMFEEVR